MVATAHLILHQQVETVVREVVLDRVAQELAALLPHQGKVTMAEQQLVFGVVRVAAVRVP